MRNIFFIPEKEYASDIKKYRPILLLCIISKVLESIIYEKRIVSIIFSLVSCQLIGFTSSQSRLFQIPTHLANIYNSTDQTGI